MSVLDYQKIDGIAKGNDSRGIKLLISDHLDWENEYEHLLSLQEKINAYITFCESQQYKEIYEDCIVEYAVFEIYFKYDPTSNAIKFLETVNSQLNELGISIEYYIG